jgi:hypothetical protein
VERCRPARDRSERDDGHEGAEKADWGDDKLERVDGRRPVVYPGPSFELSPEVKTIPSDPAAAWRDFPWIAFEGRWGALGTGATDFFCSAVAGGSEALRRFLDEPLPMLLAVGALLALVVFGISPATWRPTAPLRIARRRAWGQILASSARMYGGRFHCSSGSASCSCPSPWSLRCFRARP